VLILEMQTIERKKSKKRYIFQYYKNRSGFRNESYSTPHEGQTSMKEFPCNSASFSLGIPDRRWRPSTFWHMNIISDPNQYLESKQICLYGKITRGLFQR